MTAEEKIEYVKDAIEHQIAINPSGSILYRLYDVVDEMEDAVALSKSDQIRIIYKLREDNYLKHCSLNDLETHFKIEKHSDVREKTSIDFVMEAISFFQSEYDKVKLKGLTYNYQLGWSEESIYLSESFLKRDEYPEKLEAIKELKSANFISEYKIVSNIATPDLPDQHNDHLGIFFMDYASCTLNEDQLSKEAPKSTDFGTDSIVKKVIHEHSHKFQNSIQEKSITINSNPNNRQADKYFISKKGMDFYYKGQYLDLSRRSDYYKVFSIIFSLAPNGGEIPYSKILKRIRGEMKAHEDKTDVDLKKVIHRNLTERGNGFQRKGNLKEYEDNGKPLLAVEHGIGIIFNNGDSPNS